MLETKEIIKRVRNIEITTKRLVDGLISGNYHSVFKGQGIEFSEIKEYRVGDDIRSIDWNVTARFDRPFIKEFIEERDLRVHFLFDCSSSGSFGNKFSKKRKAIELTASLMFSAMKNNDNVGLFLFSDGIDLHVPARKGKRHVLKLLSHLVSEEVSGKKTNLSKSLSYLSKVLKRKSVVFLVSDFFDRNFEKNLSILKKRHDVIALNLFDHREMEFPDVGLIELEDFETGEQILVDTSDKDFRENYSRIMALESKRISDLFSKHGVDEIKLFSDDDFVLPLKKFFRTRKRRVFR